MQNKMELHKKSQDTSIGRNIILLVIILLLVFGAMTYIIWISKDIMFAYIDKIFS